METIDSSEQKSLTLEVTENAKAYLRTMASWTNFYAILSFVVIGCYVLFYAIIMFTMNNTFSHLNTPFSSHLPMGIFVFIVAAVLFFPALYLLRFSQKTNKALQEEDTQILEEALRNMKSYWKFIGIMSIIGIVILIITIPVTFIAMI
jgi:H+/Cl- antiporter ClcA